ncbi:MAG TPA: hypothetical protein VM889_11755 [Candidatus Thermoplasmatota archaeon]|nr:hypothetical protein [Candidatus Thermoplasmatota archaeon]
MASADLFDPELHFRWMSRCARKSRAGEVLLATPEGSRYPYVYPRDLAGTARVLREMIARDFHAEDAFRHLESGALFLLEAGREGTWGQRYDLEGRDRSIYVQEDNVAHAMRVIALYLLECRRQGREPERGKELVEALVAAFDDSTRRVYRKGINLFYSTTTVHESPIESGYTLWNNMAYHRAFEQLARVLEAYRPDDARRERAQSFCAMHAVNMHRHFVQDGRFVRRITPQGRIDTRSDITLLSPHYFNFPELDARALEASARKIENDLWDPDLGLLQRYLPFAEDLELHLHAGNGPWLAYTAIYAGYLARHGDVEKAERTLRDIAAYATHEGALPEHLSTRERFLDFWEREWQTGIDFQKEFAKEILLPDVRFSRIVEELNHMRAEYERIRSHVLATDDPLIRFATPLLWSHAEFLLALFALEDRRKVSPP